MKMGFDLQNKCFKKLKFKNRIHLEHLNLKFFLASSASVGNLPNDFVSFKLSAVFEKIGNSRSKNVCQFDSMNCQFSSDFQAGISEL
jgi:hypothetical protein